MSGEWAMSTNLQTRIRGLSRWHLVCGLVVIAGPLIRFSQELEAQFGFWLSLPMVVFYTTCIVGGYCSMIRFSEKAMDEQAERDGRSPVNPRRPPG
jgi:hypothetical protein